jgi:putative oxidoreductase
MIMKILDTFDSFSRAAAALIPDWALALVARLGIFVVFWYSAQKKLAGDLILGQKLAFWNISDSAFMQFEYRYDVPLLPSSVAAYLCTWGEFFFSLGILFGLLTRFSALGLFAVSLVILYVHTNDWPNILLWAGLLLYLLKNGAGAISLDALIRKRM